MTVLSQTDLFKGTTNKMSTSTLSPTNSLTDKLLQSVLGKEAPNECIVQGQNISDIGILSENYSAVRRLDISFNALRNFRGIDQFPKLRELSAYCCRLDDVAGVGDTTHLISLLLQQNGITSFPSSFKTLKNLRELRVDRNQLTSIENLSGCSSLRILDISFNNIESLSGLAGLQSLQELRANNNKISSLQTLKSLPSIRELQVSHNKLVSLDGVQYLPTLETIHADHNTITTIKVPQTFMKKKNINLKLESTKSNSSSSLKVHQKGSTSNISSSSSTALIKDASVTTLGLLALTDVFLSHNQIASLDGLNSLGMKIEVLDIEFNCLDLSADKMESLVAIVSTLKQLNELKMNKGGFGGNAVQLAAALFSACSSLTVIDGKTVAGGNSVEEPPEKVLGYEKNTNYDSSGSDDSDYEAENVPVSLKRQASSKRRVSVSGSATAIKEIAQIDDVTQLEGQFKKIITNCRDTWTAFLRLTAPGVSSEPESPVKPVWPKRKVEAKIVAKVVKEETVTVESTQRILDSPVDHVIDTAIATSSVTPPRVDTPGKSPSKAHGSAVKPPIFSPSEKEDKGDKDINGSFFISQQVEEEAVRPSERPSFRLHINAGNSFNSSLPQPPSSNNSTGELRAFRIPVGILAGSSNQSRRVSLTATVLDIKCSPRPGMTPGAGMTPRVLTSRTILTPGTTSIPGTTPR